MAGEEATSYMAVVARCHFPGCGRPDIQYKCHDRGIAVDAKAVLGDYDNITRIGKYLGAVLPRMQHFFVR